MITILAIVGGVGDQRSVLAILPDSQAEAVFITWLSLGLVAMIR